MSKGISSVVKLILGTATILPTLVGNPVTTRASTNRLCNATMTNLVPLQSPTEVSKLRNRMTGAWVFSSSRCGGIPPSCCSFSLRVCKYMNRVFKLMIGRFQCSFDGKYKIYAYLY